MPFTARRSPPPNAKMDMTSEERDQRTVFILQVVLASFIWRTVQFFFFLIAVLHVKIVVIDVRRQIFQIAKETRPRDLEEFFSSVGHVRDVRIITDSKTRRSKGICYVEFWEIESVNLVSIVSKNSSWYCCTYGTSILFVFYYSYVAPYCRCIAWCPYIMLNYIRTVPSTDLPTWITVKLKIFVL